MYTDAGQEKSQFFSQQSNRVERKVNVLQLVSFSLSRSSFNATVIASLSNEISNGMEASRMSEGRNQISRKGARKENGPDSMERQGKGYNK